MSDDNAARVWLNRLLARLDSWLYGDLDAGILEAVGRLGGDGYGATIRAAMPEATEHRPSLGAVFARLEQLERRELVVSRLEPGDTVRGYRTRRCYRLAERPATGWVLGMSQGPL